MINNHVRKPLVSFNSEAHFRMCSVFLLGKYAKHYQYRVYKKKWCQRRLSEKMQSFEYLRTFRKLTPEEKLKQKRSVKKNKWLKCPEAWQSQIVHNVSIQLLSPVWLFVTHGLQHTRPPCPSPTPGVYSNSCPSSQWCHPAISSSVITFSSHLQSFPASGSGSQFLPSGDQSIGASASTSVPPMNIQDWSPLGWTGWISLQSKGLSRVFSHTTVPKHQFSAQLSL